MSPSKAMRRGFSLIELVIVVVIIGIIAAIAMPRMSRGATGAADSAVVGDLSLLRSAIDLFQTEHGGIYPVNAKLPLQLTGYSDDLGVPQATADATHIYGPYVRAIPPLPVGAAKGGILIAATTGAGVGWLYDDTTHNIIPNTTAGEKDAKGIAYSAY